MNLHVLTTRLSRGVLLAAAALALCTPAAARGQARYDPRLDFRTLSTPRFDIYYHQQEEALAQRLAGLVEEVAAEIDGRLGAPAGRVRIILVDQTDRANGWATVIPYNLIELTAVPPPSHSTIGNTRDWLRLVFAHEYTHVVHLAKSRGWLGSLRRIFGRNPLFYSNLFVPHWQIEGLATYEESTVTGRGRVPAGDFRMLLDEAAAAGRFAPLDRATGALVDWPAGHSAYLYGAYFHQFLADRYGSESLARLADETAGRLPFFGSPAFKSVFGRSLGDLWQDFEADTRARLRTDADRDRSERLTHHGFTVSAPAFTADGRLFYSVSNPHGFPALMERPADGSAPREVATRYGGDRLTAAGNLLIFDQLEIVRNTALLSDIHAVSLHDGTTRRLTRETRAADPDAAPDGRTIACTVQESGRRILATFRIPAPGQLAEPAPLLSEAATEFSTPRWSPDGRSIVAERRRLGGPSEIVIVDVAARTARTLVSSPVGRNMTPMWLPDGEDILFSSDRSGGPFTLYAANVTTGAVTRLADAPIGAQFPALSPDRRQLVFIGYSADGHDLYALPFDSPEWIAPPVADTIGDDGPRAVSQPSGDALPSRRYSPWPTLAPRLWLPILAADGDDLLVGAATTGFDALGRHSYWVATGWSSRNRPYLQVDYAYTRWRPALFVTALQDTDVFRDGTVRSRELGAGVLLPVRRVRWSTTAMAALHMSNDAFDCAACAPPVDAVRKRRALRAGWNVSNAQSFGYSVGPEQGAYAGATSELTRRALGADADAGAVTADLRGYLRAFPRHGVLAARLAGASSWGDDSMRRVFSAGGSGPRPAGLGFDADAIGLLRGFGGGDLSGYHAAVANLDYRFPLFQVQRGAGTLPVFLRQVHGALFADAGTAWDAGFSRSNLQRSFGGELSADVVAGSVLPLTLTAGAAWRDDPRAPKRRGWVAFGRLGRAF